MKCNSSERNAIAKAVEFLGGPLAVSRLFAARGARISRQAVEKWTRVSLPAKWVLPLEELTERRWTRYELRPDLYPRDGAPAIARHFRERFAA